MVNGVSGACALSSALPGRKTVKRLAILATEYVVVKQGVYEEWKTCIYGKGAAVYKSIYIKGTQRR